MKTTIFYFSATGNSLHAARSLAASLGETVTMSISGLRKVNQKVVQTPVVGFVFPTHYFGLPPVVDQFIRSLAMENVQYIFAVTTCGSRHINSALTQTKRLLEAKGRTLNSGFHVEMISSYIPLSNLPSPGYQQKKLAEADKKIQAIADAILAGKDQCDNEYLRLPATGLNTYWTRKLLPQADRKFSCSSSCVSCGICEKVCPVDNIRLAEGQPQWLHHCQECLACLHFCPARSIEFGARTAGRSRYHHPAIQVADIIQSKVST